MSERPAPIPSPEKVLDALRQAGWLLEQDTQTELTKAGFVVTPGAAFPDPDDKTASRDIDVMGWKTVVLDEDQSLHVAIRVLAECKQSSMPYVVVGRSTTERDRSRPRPEHTSSRPAVTIARVPSREGGTLLREVPSHRYLGLESVPPWSDDFVATQMTRLDLKNGTWSAGNDGIFTSLVYPLAKASAYFHAQTKDARGSVELRFPVVVTSAPVFQLNVDDEEMVPKIVPWTTLARNITTASLKGNFRIDVVSYSALGQYLSERIGPLEAALRAVPIQRFFTSEDMEWEAPATM